MQLCEPGVIASEATSECIALRRSREPPVFTCLGGTSDQRKLRRWRDTRKAAPLQAMGDHTSHELANPFDDEYQDEAKKSEYTPHGSTSL